MYVCVCVYIYIYIYTIEGIYVYTGAKCSSVVERLFMVQWVFGSIPHYGPNEIFLVPVSTLQLV